MTDVTVMALGPEWLDPVQLLSSSGPFGAAVLPAILVIIFIESGLFFPFLPGDSMLFTAGLLASQPDGFAPLWQVLLLAPIAAILGDQVGYWIGHRFHPKLRERKDGRFFKQEHLHRSEEFFDKYGAITIVLARFVPFVRTYAPLVAGMSGMNYRTFISFNIIGAALWASGIVYLGSLLGGVEFVRNNIEAIFLGIVAFTVVPAAWAAWQKRRRPQTAAAERPLPSR